MQFYLCVRLQIFTFNRHEQRAFSIAKLTIINAIGKANETDSRFIAIHTYHCKFILINFAMVFSMLIYLG